MKNAIIVADDSLIVKNIVEKALSSEYKILKASNGKEVINLLNRYNNVVCLLLDLNMPEYDGFMVLDYFKENQLFKIIPISIISGDDSKDTIQKAFKYDIVDMLNKPFSLENIRNVVNKTISIREK